MADEIEYEKAVVLDTGSGNIKVGWAGGDAPLEVFPAVIGRPREGVDVEGALGGQELFMGHEAEKKRDLLTLEHPLEHAIVSNWDIMEKIWEHCFFEVMKVDPTDQPVLLTEPPLNPLANREKMVQIMFETFDVPALYVAMQAVLALYSQGRTSGLVLDSGDGVTHVVPVMDGYTVMAGISRLDLAGRDLTRYMAKLLTEQGLDMSDTAAMEAVREIKEKFAYVALDPAAEKAESKEPDTYTLPDGKVISVTTERWRCPEPLFSPGLVGLEPATHPGIHLMCQNAVNKCDMNIRRELYNNVLLSGGNTLFNGIAARLEKELKNILPGGVAPRVMAPPERAFSVWMGGAISASLSGQQWVSRLDYDEEGFEAVHRMTMDGRREGR